METKVNNCQAEECVNNEDGKCKLEEIEVDSSFECVQYNN